jgi:hypothetical protein
MTWFTENPWPPIFILGIAACVMLAVWSSQKRAIWLMGALTAVIAAMAVFVVERSIITEGERVEKKVLELTAAFQARDKDRLLSFFSVQAPEWRLVAQTALDRVTIKDDLSIKDMSVRVTNENSRAVSRFRANGTVLYEGNNIGHHPSRWELTWQKEGNDWKIVDVQRLDLIKDQKLGIFDQRPN